MSGVFVAGTGKYIPSQVVSNSDLAKIVDTSDEWITDRTGIKERRFSSGEPTWYMGKLAAQDAIKDAKIDPQNIDLIIACTITPDYFTPSLACIIQSEIGAENAFCFDINAACSGFIYAFDAAQRYLVTDGANTVLIVCSEILSKLTDFSDRSTCVLFGDGAASVVLIKDDSRVFSSEIKSEGRSGSALLSRSIRNESPYATDQENVKYNKFPQTTGNFVMMDGREVYRFATKVLAESVEVACKKAGISVGELDLIVPHQANIRIVQTAAEKLKVDMSKMYINLERYGNTSCASIPICLDELYKSGRIQRGMKIALAGFGGGLTYGAIVLEW